MSCFPAEILREKKGQFIVYLFSASAQLVSACSSEYRFLVTTRWCLDSDSLEANELLLWDTEIRKEIHGPCQFSQSSYHPLSFRDFDF